MAAINDVLFEDPRPHILAVKHNKIGTQMILGDFNPLTGRYRRSWPELLDPRDLITIVET